MTARNTLIVGYGYSPEGLAAAWQELEAGLPTKGADCPHTLDLLDLHLVGVVDQGPGDVLDELLHCRTPWARLPT